MKQAFPYLRTLLHFFVIQGFFCYAFSEDPFKCPEQFGYYPDYRDCSKYYVCVFGDSLHEKCTGGLHFSIELQTCDWPRNVECANGAKPGEKTLRLPIEDEIFSSSRRQSTTANSGNSRGRPSNPEPISNYQSFENEETKVVNTGSRIPENQRTRNSGANSAPATGQPQVSSATTVSPASQQKQPNPTTYGEKVSYIDDKNIPSTVSEDPLYASDERSKITSPLDNYDPQQPEYDEAAPSFVDPGGIIHIADGGHGIGGLEGLIHLPGLGFSKSLKSPAYDSSPSNTNRNTKTENDHKEQRDSVSAKPSLAVSTNPRSLENFQSNNNGRSKDPDVVINYSNANKEADYNYPNRQRTPPPTIFDDSVDHRDYGRFDVITPLKANIQEDHDPTADIERIKISLDKNDPQTIRGYLDKPNTPERTFSELQKVPQTNSFNENNGAIGTNSKTDEDTSLQSHVNNDRHSENFANPALSKDTSIAELHPIDFDKEVPRLQANNYQNRPANVENSEHETTLIDSTKERGVNRPTRINGKNLGDSIDSTNYREPVEITKEKNIFTDRINHQHSGDVSQNSNENTRKVEIRTQGTSPDKNLPDNLYDEMRMQIRREHDKEAVLSNLNNNGAHFQRDNQDENTNLRDSNTNSDESFSEVHLEENFGIYNGNRQNRKLEVGGKQDSNSNIDNSRSNVVISAESVQPAVLQPNLLPQNSATKDKNEAQHRDAAVIEQYDSRHVYPNYSAKPDFTDDYFTKHEDNEPTSKVVPIKARPTRPRKPTTAATTTTSTTPAPIRYRTRRPIGQVTRAPNKAATTPATLPYRPVNVYPTPTPYTSAQKCDPRKCKLPDCRCGGTEVPAGIPVNETPQIVLLTFDDAVNELNHDLYNELFNTGRVNPNGCPILGTFYVSHEWTDYGQVQSLYSQGHEIASHSITHSYGEKFSKNQWMREIHGQREILHLYGGVKMEDIRGMRAPFLQIGGNKMFEMLFDANFTYDSSMPVYENNPPFWPYTLDYALGHDCMIFPCPTKSYPGLWEIGMVMWVDLRGGRCSMGDACSNPSDEESVTKMLMKNFNRHYKTNRAPFGLFFHSAWFNTQHHRRGFMKFLDEILQNDNVWLVTNWQLIQWMRDPTPISKMKNFEPFNCRRLDRPPVCPNPTVCNVWYQGGVRYMKTCQPCPVKYPWIGNTGYDANKG